MKKLSGLIVVLIVCGGAYFYAGNAGRIAERNKATMKRFETMINTNDKQLAKELVDGKAPFYTPASPTPLYGGEGYLSVVDFMRSGFSDVQWKIEDMVAENNVVAVRWNLTATHDGEFMGLAPTGTKIDTTVMNFYYFNDEGKVVNDIAAVGMIGILRPLGLSK
jgi:predicted ester cyclase